MGASFSYSAQERTSWSRHSLVFDETTRETNLSVIDLYFPANSEIQLAKQNVCVGGCSYQHFFITDTKGAHFLEFICLERNPREFYSAFRVQSNTLPHGTFEVLKKKNVTLEIKERMVQMLGMSNYSLCLRNSEHVANYIFSGIWASFQMEGDGCLLNYFSYAMTESVRKEINQFPSAILPKTVGAITGPKVYSMIDQHYAPARFNFFSDFNEETYNILVVGPTGAGKSRLINVLFNTEICESQVSHKSVTRDVCFIEGQGEIIDWKTSVKQMKKVVVADTVGLCDTEWDDHKILALIKGRVGRKFKNIDAAFIVFKADRLSKEQVKNIKEIMKWLNYNRSNHLSFLFVGMCAENLCPLTKENLKKQAREMLGLIDTKLPGNEYESLVYVGFPPEDQLNDNGKEGVKKSWDLLQPLVRLNENSMQLKDYKLHVANQTFWKLPEISRSCTIL